MSTFKYFNVSTTAETELAAIETVNKTGTYPYTGIGVAILGPPKYVTMCNKDASGDDCVVELFIENTSATPATVHILHDTIIPSGATLILEEPELNYDTTVYALKFKLTSVAATQLVDIKVEY